MDTLPFLFGFGYLGMLDTRSMKILCNLMETYPPPLLQWDVSRLCGQYGTVVRVVETCCEDQLSYSQYFPESF